jgi:signal peptidase I
MKRRRWIRLLWILTGWVALLLLLKFFVADVYRVDSGSMRPTIFGGRDRADGEEDTEHVLVLYDRGFEPERFDLVVIRSPDGSQPLVKRVCGLPGEHLMIRDGDLFIDRARLPPDAPRPAPVPVYDDRYLEPERFFERRRDGSVRREGDEWVVDGGVGPPGSMLRYHHELRDDYLDRWHRRVPGVIDVNDAVLELEFRIEAPLETQRLRFQLVEQGDLFEVEVAARSAAGGSAGRGASLRLVRRDASKELARRDALFDDLVAQEPPLAEAPVELEAGRWYRLLFSNIDNHLWVRCDGLGLDLRCSYDENRPWPSPLPAGQKSLGWRVSFGAEAGRARFRAVRILRDLYYTDDGIFGVGSHPENAKAPAPVSLGPDDYFLLGDNSAASTDSRHFGSVKAPQLLGRPLAVVWPRPRWLRAVERP